MYLRADPAAFVKGGNDQKRSHAAAKAAEAAAPEATEAATAAPPPHSGCADAQLLIFRVGKEVRRPLTLETSQHF